MLREKTGTTLRKNSVSHILPSLSIDIYLFTVSEKIHIFNSVHKKSLIEEREVERKHLFADIWSRVPP